LGLDDPDGVVPVRMHKSVPESPARGKAQGRNDLQVSRRTSRSAGRVEKRTADGSEAQKPIQSHARSAANSALMFPKRRQIDPTKINRGVWLDEQARGPGRTEMPGHPSREQACEGRQNPMSAADPGRGKDHSDRPGREGSSR